jgi:hypothetical protein
MNFVILVYFSLIEGNGDLVFREAFVFVLSAATTGSLEDPIRGLHLSFTVDLRRAMKLCSFKACITFMAIDKWVDLLVSCVDLSQLGDFIKLRLFTVRSDTGECLTLTVKCISNSAALARITAINQIVCKRHSVGD